MLLKNLSNFHLVERFNKLVRTERKITQLVLECISEIDCRKLYLQKAYSSLFDYLVNEFGYSPSAASRRIESARLLREVPEMAEKIETGALNLSQLSKVQQAIRTIQKAEERRMGTYEKRELLRKIENTTQEKTELILAKELNLPVEVVDRIKIHRDESVTVTMSFSKEQMQLLKKVGDLISHAVPDKKWAHVVTYLAQKELSRRTKQKNVGMTKHKKVGRTNQESIGGSKTTMNCEIDDKVDHESENSQPVLVIAKPGSMIASVRHPNKFCSRKPIPSSLRKTILHPQASCGFQDLLTGKLCGSQRFLQVDHRHPVWAGGTNNPENLRALCFHHNQYKYKQELGLHP